MNYWPRKKIISVKTSTVQQRSSLGRRGNDNSDDEDHDNNDDGNGDGNNNNNVPPVPRALPDVPKHDPTYKSAGDKADLRNLNKILEGVTKEKCSN